MRAAIHGGLLRDQNEVGTDPPRFIDHHNVFNACGLGLTRTGNDTGLVAFIGDDADGAATEPWIKLLFDTGKEAIEVEIEVFDGIRSVHHFVESRGMTQRT